jgi:site-specific recombinase XerD
MSPRENAAAFRKELRTVSAGVAMPALIESAGDRVSVLFLEFFASAIRNANTRRAYARAAADFLAWCEGDGVTSIVAVQPLHVAAWIDLQTKQYAAPTVKQRLAAIRHLFDWLVTGKVVFVNPATSVRASSHHVVLTDKALVLEPTEALEPVSTDVSMPELVASACERVGVRILESFVSAIHNANTRRAYARAAADFLAWCEGDGVTSITAVQPLHVAAWVELQAQQHAPPTVKQRLAAIRHLFDWLVTGQVVPVNPAASVHGPNAAVLIGKTPVLKLAEAQALLDSIDVTSPVGLRDRALIALMVFSFARVGVALAMRVEDVYVQQRRLWVRLREKGGKVNAMPCHHTLEAYLRAYVDGTGITAEPKGPLFRTIRRGTGQLSKERLPQANAYAMVRRRAAAAGIATKIGNHTLRATGIAAYLENGGTLASAAAMANHASTRTTQLYDRRHDDIGLDEVERIHI